ncbi:hypothetical protein V6U90_17145 [Micromonospora sp. CPCC 206060]|uniref:hypothetical protein n=1 Tax=Micromonospora sp. CPCC 206060 TaxID=3122406 RepID=UPI002FEFAD64
MKAAPAPALPRAVFAASYLLAGVTALALVSAIGGFYAIPEFSYLKGKQAHDSGAEVLAVFGLLGFTILAIVFGGLCLLLALLSGKGSAAARVLTWLVGGVTVCFNVVLLVVGAFQSVPWYGDLTRILAVAMLLLSTGSITLLALPASHRYFRAAQAARPQRRPRPPFPPPPHFRPTAPGYPPLGYQPPTSPLGAHPPPPPPGYRMPAGFQQRPGFPPPGYELPPGNPATPGQPTTPLSDHRLAGPPTDALQMGHPGPTAPAPPQETQPDESPGETSSHTGAGKTLSE